MLLLLMLLAFLDDGESGRSRMAGRALQVVKKERRPETNAVVYCMLVCRVCRPENSRKSYSGDCTGRAMNDMDVSA